MTEEKILKTNGNFQLVDVESYKTTSLPEGIMFVNPYNNVVNEPSKDTFLKLEYTSIGPMLVQSGKLLP